MSLPEEHKTAIISNGLNFMRSITEAYGAEQGMELWDQIASVLDPEVKGQIFFAMITGNYNDRIELKGVAAHGQHNAVACIKSIRTFTGLGSKDAKDMYDRLRPQGNIWASDRKSEFIKINPEQYHTAVSALRNVGFMV